MRILLAKKYSGLVYLAAIDSDKTLHQFDESVNQPDGNFLFLIRLYFSGYSNQMKMVIPLQRPGQGRRAMVLFSLRAALTNSF